MASRPPSSASQHSRSPKTPSTQILLPPGAMDYNPTVSNPELRSKINAALLNEGHIAKIQATLTHSLSSHPSNWPTLIRAHALSILRSGEATSFPQLMERVLADIKADTDMETDTQTTESNGSNGAATNPASSSMGTAYGSQTTNTDASRGNGNGGEDSSSQSSGGGDGMWKEKGKAVEAKRRGVSLALPKTVVDEGIKVTRECLKEIVKVDGE